MKLGKKARKFARKHLQSTLKRRRKLKSTFKRKSAPRRGDLGNVGDDEKVKQGQRTEGLDDSLKVSDGILLSGSASDNYLENLFLDDDNGDLDEGMSDSDGYLTEDSECPYISENEYENGCRGDSSLAVLQGQNSELSLEMAKQKKKLENLQKKDPQFIKFLESQQSDMGHYGRGYSDEDEPHSSDEDGTQDGKNSPDTRVLTSTTIDVWCWLVKEEPNGPALRNLLNAFRDACLYGLDSNGVISRRIQSTEVFSKLITFVLSEADEIFCKLLGVLDNSNKQIIMKLKGTSEWKFVMPLLKSYLWSSLELLDQITDNQILIFLLSRLRASIVFFSAFPSFLRRLIKISVHLWATGDERLSLSSFLVIRDIAMLLSSDCLDICLTRTYKSFIARCKLVEDASAKHIDFMLNSAVELYSLDVQKSYHRVSTCVQQLAAILRQAFKTKKKEELSWINNWQYVYCISLWVKYIACNYRDNDLQPLFSSVIQVIWGVAHLFPGPRFLPLRIKCAKMLNELSLSSGVFIPITSLVLDCLEYRETSNIGTSKELGVKFLYLLKVPKNLLKSRDFQEECILSAVDVLSAHFAQWSYHISFPELTTVPLIFLKRFCDKTTADALRRLVKRLIDQVEHNRDFIQRKRDEVSFSPSDQASVESFLQLEKSGAHNSFTQFYANVCQNSLTRNMVS